ncbi:glycosyltransferase WbuB [Cryobacterium tepidiphilum]|uniref:Glycosyltransferase WbuB n=1 Tax=Cryobacterium tepidiphilum TaxID=2486026 RepID=A0A3M8LDT8_9MICO|nr:glycosyltransferase WbuB [Cryobacterium tepidiphilum]
MAPYAGSFASGLAGRGIDVHVLTTYPHYPDWRFRGPLVRWTHRECVEGVAVTRLRHYLPSKPEGVRRLLSEISFGARLLAANWSRPDVVVLVSPALFSSALAMLRARFSPRKPAVTVWVQDLYSLGIREMGSGGGTVARAMRWMESMTLRAASRVVVIHSRFAAYVTDELGVDADRVDVVRNWTHLGPTPTIDVGEVRNRHGWTPGETVVLHAGNMGVKQGLENVIDAARLASERSLPLKFVLLGNGNQRAALEEYGRDVDGLQFLSSLDDVGFQSALGSADILLVNEKPGVSEMAVPSKLTSYFSSGRPVVAATDLSGVTAEEIRASVAGMVVQAGDPQALVDVCLQLREDPEQASVLGANGQRYRKDVLGQEPGIDLFAGILRTMASRQRR